MSSPVASTSALPPIEDNGGDKISAYYSLAFPNFTYYLQTLTVTIGRRPIPSASSSSSDPQQVDVDLGPLKSVSRLHARIEYEEEEERFVLVVLGRNGAWVDGIWAASGSRVPLGARSQIQIATRTFDFILPPPPEPEVTPFSPPPSTNQDHSRSPSVDITDLSPGPSRQASPIPFRGVSTPLDVKPQVATKASKSSRKRKRPEPEQLPPGKMPPKPLATLPVMCYRAITALGGKAALQEVIQWMIDNYDWYRLNAGGPWENSVRHSLSSSRAFRSMAKTGDEKGKGFLWGIEPKSLQMLQEQDAKAQQAEIDRQIGQQHPVPPPPVQAPPAKPAFTKEPLKSKEKPMNGLSPPHKKANPASAPLATPVAPAVPSTSTLTTASVSAPSTSAASTSVSAPQSTAPSSISPIPSGGTQPPPTLSNPSVPANVSLPIVVAPLPDSYHASAALASTSSPASAILTNPPIVVHEGKLILSPTVFAHLTPENIKELEKMGTQKAIQTLQPDIVRFLKAKIRSEGQRARGRVRGRGRGGLPGRIAGKALQKADGTLPNTSRESKTQSINAESDATGAAGTSSAEVDVDERVAKRQKLEEDAVNMDVDVDIMGT